MKRAFCILLSIGMMTGLALVAQAQSVPAWQPDTAFSTGQLVTFNGQEFQCIQAHTSQVGWEPPNVPALWKLIGPAPTGSPAPSPTPTLTPFPTPTPTPSPTPKPTPTPSPTPSPSPTPIPSGGTCAAAWLATQIYHGGDVASVGNNNFTAAFFSQNQNPTLPGNSGAPGSGDPWGLPVACTSGGPTPTPTPTPSPNPSPTPTPSPTATPSPTPTPTPGGGPNVACSATPWNSTATFTGGMEATFNGFLWQANFFTQGDQPAPIESGPWKVVGICGQLPGPNPARLAAPYVDVTLPLFNTVTSAVPRPVKFLTLAFVIAQNGCQASWAGTMPIPATGTPPLMSQLNSYRANGGDFGISFGGAAGTELALACTDANSLAAQYQNVINQYHPKFIDFDLETSATNDNIREQAIAMLQHNNPGLAVSYTLQTEPTGINDLANTILKDAVAAGVQIGVVNVMSMDLGGAFDNNGQMGLSAQRSGWSVQDTLNVLLPGKTRSQIAAMVGVTVMIGTNDNEAEIFQLADINTLVQTALDNGWGRISFWSLTRDQDCRTVPGIGVLTPQPASGECSGVSQNQFQYAGGFDAFNP